MSGLGAPPRSRLASLADPNAFQWAAGTESAGSRAPPSATRTGRSSRALVALREPAHEIALGEHVALHRAHERVAVEAALQI